MSSTDYISPAEAKASPQALFNVVMGKHIPGMPISWLKFWVFVCLSSDYEVPDYVWKVVEGEPTFTKELTPEYTEKMKKLIDNATALDVLRKKVRSESGQVSSVNDPAAAAAPKRFHSRSHHKKHHKKKASTFMWKTTKTSLIDLFRHANQKVHVEVMRLRRLRKSRKHHLRQ